MSEGFEPMPGYEPIILTRVPALLYCNKCMKEMRCLHDNIFACPVCGMNYEKETAA